MSIPPVLPILFWAEVAVSKGLHTNLTREGVCLEFPAERKVSPFVLEGITMQIFEKAGLAVTALEMCPLG